MTLNSQDRKTREATLEAVLRGQIDPRSLGPALCFFFQSTKAHPDKYSLAVINQYTGDQEQVELNGLLSEKKVFQICKAISCENETREKSVPGAQFHAIIAIHYKKNISKLTQEAISLMRAQKANIVPEDKITEPIPKEQAQVVHPEIPPNKRLKVKSETIEEVKEDNKPRLLRKINPFFDL
jgi:hypothetical protein